MAREKIKFALRIAPETQQLVKELCERDNCQSQNEFIEKAIRFYAGYVSGKEATAYAQYFLEHMDDRLGQPPVAAVISLFHHLANIFQEQNQPPPSGGVRVAVDRKLLRKIKAKKIAQGHKADDHEPEMQL